MPFFQPAARAHQANRHPALDAHVGRRSLSPGAGRGSPHLYNNNKLYHDHDSPTVITPTPTLNAAVEQASSVGNILTSSTAVGSVATQPSTLGLSLSDPVPSSDIILSSSSSSPSSSSHMSIPTTTTVTPSLQSPASGSSTMPAKGGVISSAPADSALNAEANSPSHHPSGGVIAAIVIVLLLALGAVAFFVFRRYQIQRRAVRRVTWTTNLSPHPFDASLEKGVNVNPAFSSDSRIETAGQSSREGGNGQVKTVSPVRIIARKPPLPYSPAISPIPPSPSQSHLTVPDARTPSMDAASVSISTAPSTPMPDVPALVRMTFVPQLPDELAITPGETVYIRTDYDDGWALCTNSRGKHGMVPLECLEGGGGHFAGRSHLRTMRRASSLNSAVTWS